MWIVKRFFSCQLNSWVASQNSTSGMLSLDAYAVQSNCSKQIKSKNTAEASHRKQARATAELLPRQPARGAQPLGHELPEAVGHVAAGASPPLLLEGLMLLLFAGMFSPNATKY